MIDVLIVLCILIFVQFVVLIKIVKILMYMHGTILDQTSDLMEAHINLHQIIMDHTKPIRRSDDGDHNRPTRH